jgi:hypothetical protein
VVEAGRTSGWRGRERSEQGKEGCALSRPAAAEAGSIEGRERSEQEEEGAAATRLSWARSKKEDAPSLARLRQKRASEVVVGGRPPEPPLRPAGPHMPPHPPCGRRGRT